MRKTLPRSLVGIGLVVAIFAFPSAAWADPGGDKKDKKDHPVTQAEEDPAPPEEVEPEPDPVPEIVEEPVEEPPIEEEVAEEPEVTEPAEETEESKTEAAKKSDEDELEEEQQEIPINPGNVPTTAAGFGTPSCDHIPGNMAPEGQDGWVFVLPGNDASFVSVSASFAEDGTIDGTVAEGHDGKFAYVLADAGWTLTGATAVINGTTPQGTFNLTHACPGVPPPPEECEDGSQPPCEEEPPPPCDDGREPPCEEEPPPPCDDGSNPPCEEEPPPPCEDGSDPPCEEEPPPPDDEEPPDDEGTPPVTMHPPTQPELEEFAPQSSAGGDGLAITGNSLGLLMLIGTILLTAGGAALVLYRVANRARKLGGGVDG